MFRTSLLLLLLLLLTLSASAMLLGRVESPGYPHGYPPHATYNWSRCAKKGHSISLRLIHLDLEDSYECENDAVKVFSNKKIISVLCGKKNLEELQSSVNPTLVSLPGGCLSLSFYSDYSNTKRHTGFRGFYTDKDYDECRDDPDNQCTQFCHNYIGGYYCSCQHGYHLDKDKHTCTVSCSEDLSGQRRGKISSPSWPAPYAENANCQYTLSVEDHLQLELEFSTDFDVEQSPDGPCIDALRIETPSETMGPFCGHTPPPSPLLTQSHNVKVRFTTDSFGTNKGFSLRFGTRGKVCPAVVSLHSTATPQQADYKQGQTVTVKCEPGYVFNAHGEQYLLAQYEATCQPTGKWSPSFSCEPVDCGSPEIPKDGILQPVGSYVTRTQYRDQVQFRCTSEYYTLKGDDTYICNAMGEWVSAGGRTEMPKCIEVCGRPEQYSSSAGRILGGKDASLGEIPWQLLIRNPRRGGASLISDQWAVTAAHMVEGLGETSLTLYGGLVHGRDTRNQRAVLLNSERIIIHPDYIEDAGAQRTNYDNDIALIKFSSRVTLGPRLLPICLPDASMNLVVGEQGTVSGFGKTEGKETSDLITSKTLKYAYIGVYDDAQCRSTPTLDSKNMIFTDNMFCAGAEGTDSCQQDSGGPFVTPMLAQGSEPFYLSGIVSWGPPCKQRQYKGYYTKVKNYVAWIEETMHNNTQRAMTEAASD